MLHISRGTQEYLNELDRMFESTPLMSSGISKEITKTFDDIQLDWDKHYARVEAGLTSFENKLTAALSDPLPHFLVGKPRPRLRKFPHMMEGDLVGSYHQQLRKIEGDNSMTIKLNNGFGHANARMTNEGWNSGKRDVHWLHWMDEIFGDNLDITNRRHSTKVPNIRDVLLGYYS